MKKFLPFLLVLASLTPSLVLAEVTRKVTGKFPFVTIIYYDNGTQVAAEKITDKDKKILIKREGAIPDGIVKEYYDTGELLA